MVVDAKKRQQKIAKKKAKDKARRREIAHRRPQSLAGKMRQAASAPILHCRISAAFRENGIGSVLLSRELSNGMIAAGIFLIDAYCLGAKDAFGVICTPAKYRDTIVDRCFRNGFEQLEPSYARKFVEGAVAYARSLAWNRVKTTEKLPPSLAILTPTSAIMSSSMVVMGSQFSSRVPTIHQPNARQFSRHWRTTRRTMSTTRRCYCSRRTERLIVGLWYIA